MDRRSLTLVGVTGERVDLNGGPYMADRGVVMAGGPSVQISDQVSLGRHGSRVTHVRHLPRDALVPLRVMADSATELDAAISRLVRLTDASYGDVRLIARRGDGVERELSARLLEGLDGIELEMAQSSQVRVVLRFRAYEQPYWRSVEEYDIPFEQDAFDVDVPEPLWDSPRPWDMPVPWDGAGAQGVAILGILVNGDVDSWPRFEITGPGSAVEATNLRVGKSWRHDGALIAGQQLVVETEPGRKSVRIDDRPALKDLSPGAQLWGLKRGTNDIVVRILDYVPGESLFKFTARDLWLTPW